MDWIKPAVIFAGTLATRGGRAGTKRVMDENPERVAFIKSITGWDRVEHGTLTLDDVAPLSVSALDSISCLGTEPADLMPNLAARDREIANIRGVPSYYGGVAFAGPVARLVIVSQQPRPAIDHRLEVMADVRLQCLLAVQDGDTVHVTIFKPEDWRQLPDEGYHRMCG